jgi:tetratricopeptide (TPR) repeat protein
MSPNAVPNTNHAPSERDMQTLVALTQQKQHAEAERAARQLIDTYPSDGVLWQVLGVSLRSQGMLADAVDALRRAVMLSPLNASGHYLLGDSLITLQQPREAAESFHRARTLKPDLADAHFKFGNALAMQHRHNEAIAAYERVLELCPDSSQARAHLGFALARIGRHADAESHLRIALRTQADNVLINNALGVALHAQSRMSEAADSFRRVVALDPAAAEAHANLGHALRELGNYADAETHCRRAIALNDQMVQTHVDLGDSLYMLERYAEAEQSYRRALELKPDFAKAQIGLGRSHFRQGRLKGARESLERAIALDPNSVEAYGNLASLRRFVPGDPEPARMEELVAQLPFVSQESRIRFFFALGKVREDLGRYDEAFAAYAQGNQLKHAQLSPNEAGWISLIDNIRAVFNESFFVGRPTPPSHGRSPIFIVGMPRSGTSLIEQILSTHPDIHGAGELPHLENLVFGLAAEAGQPNVHYPQVAASLSEQALAQLGHAYVEQAWRFVPDVARVTDKMMSNFLHIGMIRLMFPNAKIIHAMRDPMDSCFSCYATLFAKSNLRFAYELGSLGRYYVRYIELMQHWHRVLPSGAIIDVRYEDVVADTEGQASRLLEYLELPWDPRCLNFHENERIVRTASAAQVRRPIYGSSVARWKHFDVHLAPLLDIVKNYRQTR